MATAPAVPEAQRDHVAAIARSLGIRDRDIALAPRQGQVNLTIFLGDRLVLRLPRKPRFAERLAKEAAVIPFVGAHGVPTVGLVRFDAERTVADVTYLVIERVHGRTIDEIPPTAAEGRRTYGSLGEVLVGLHALRAADHLVPGVESAEFDRRALLGELVAHGVIGDSQAVWVAEWFRSLEVRGARRSEPVLLHGDVMPSNLILDDSGQVTAIIDWGSACWGEPARDLAGFRTGRLPTVVEAYRQAAVSCRSGTDPAELALEAGVLWYQLFFVLAKLLGRTSTSERRNWSAPREARFLELLRFVAADVPAPWKSLLHLA